MQHSVRSSPPRFFARFSKCQAAAILVALLAAFALAPYAMAQTATGSVVGVVTDPTGAVVPKAEVQLVNLATNAVLTQTTNDSGQFTFPNAPLGKYKVLVKMSGFRSASIPDLDVEVNKTLNVPIKLEVGTENQVVEVTAAAAQLQTTDAQLGNTVETDAILRLPTLQRNATELLNLQPGVVPVGNGIQMRVSGAIDDQNTVTLDGIDITQNIVATGTSIPTPADSVDEFRVTTANPNANFDRASGAQMALAGRHGSNDFHGALYEYLQNSDLNSNTWDNNHSGIAKPGIRDNRFGARVGGPIVKDKTFFFANWESRRFSAVSQVNRTVPTASLRNGIIQFPDANGVVQQYNIATLDPRGIGVSPSVKAQFALMPLPNTTGGDGFNTGGYLANVSTPLATDYGVFRLDHKFSDKLLFNGSFTTYRNIFGFTTGTPDISILNGNPSSAVNTPEHSSVTSGALTYTISPTLINVFRFGYVRDDIIGQATSPTTAAGILNIPGTSTSAGPIALLIGSGVSTFIDSPIDMDTQRARYQASYTGDWQYIDDLTKIWGKHTFQFGTQINMLPFTHVRADKVLGSITSLVATVDQGSFIQLPASLTPANVTSANATNFDRYFASLTGMVDNVGVLAVRDNSLNPLPLGTPLINRTNQWATYFYAQDSWRIASNLTLYYGLSYGWQTAPTEQNNQQTIMVDATTGQPINPMSYLNTKVQSALAGQIYNPTVGFVPVGQAHRPVYNIDWGDVAPRVSLAWNPNMTSGFLGRMFGEHKSVIRGGFAMVYDRSNSVQAVEIPMLGIGFDQNISVNLPSCNMSGPGGANCNAGSSNPALSSFRVGVDGSIPLPTPTSATAPVVPGIYGETLSFQVDPNTKVGRTYNADLSFQRELPGNIVLEAAYVGRFGRDLPQAVNINQVPYMFVDNASGQSFAQAFDAVATALRTNQSAPVEPWFENQFPGLAKAKGSASATAYIVAQNSANFKNGNLSQLFINMGNYRRSIGLLPYSNDEAQMEFLRTYIGTVNYNAANLTLNKRFSHGLTLSANYTYSLAMDDGLANQNNAGFYTNSVHPGVAYGPSNFDRTHTFNAFYTYDIPAGGNHRFATHTWFDRVLSGWYTSGIVQAWSGTPLFVTEGGQVWGGGTIVTTNTGAILTNGVPSTGMNQGIGGSGGIGTSAAGATGTGMNLFANPQAVYASARPILLATDTRDGRANPFRGLPFRNMDMSFGKTTKITERINTRFSADFFNVFNHPNFANPTDNLQSPGSFGVITTTLNPPNRTNSARWIELGLRVDF
ncbi:MAG TPA: carboxypeptidase-like regulatory domain-containing protein [Bryobacteraceae bacterium]|nr:carboxypeptidase-like regulatory domain-containing protein [Bryobacteraceae bacterium]